MSTVRTVAGWVVVCVALPSVGFADTMTVTSGGSTWTMFLNPNSSLSGFFNQTQDGSASSSSSSSSTTAAAVSWSGGSGSAAASSGGGSATSSGTTADAFINFGATGNYPEAAALTTGTPQAWYLSPSVTQAFGHTPDAAEQSSFESTVLADVKQTFALAGMNPTITIDPTVAANHTISVASGVSYGPNANAIGITDVGNNGFSFIDKLNYANDPTDLEWAVAHNISHELMHAFGIGFHPDQTGTYIDSADATWAKLIDPTTTFSPEAAALITSTNYGAVPLSSSYQVGNETLVGGVDGDQEILAVPEPATLAAWSLVLGGLLVQHRRVRARAAA